MEPDGTPRRPLLRVFDADPDRHRPVDGSYVQQRWVRLYRPGPLRSAAVVALGVSTTWVAMAGLVGVTAQHGLIQRIIAAAIAAACVSLVGWTTVRVLAAGVYVNDNGMRLLRVRQTTLVPWSAVVDIRRTPDGDASRVVAVLDDGTDLTTAISTRSWDFVGRREALDMAALGLERWWTESRP